MITVEVTNGFKGLNLMDRVTEELWTKIRDIIQEAGIKIIPKKNKCEKEKWFFEEALQIAEKRRKDHTYSHNLHFKITGSARWFNPETVLRQDT